MIESLHTFSFEYQLFVLVAHILGTVLGLGGATISDLFFFKFLKDFRISKFEADVMQWMAKIVIGGLLIIYASGFFLFWSDPTRYLHSGPFLFKMTVVIILSINGILLHEYIAPKLRHISFLEVHSKHFPEVHRLRRLAFAMGAISFTSWYIAFLMAMLKSIVPQNIQYTELMLIYATIIAVAIFCSQLMEAYLHRRGRIFEQ